MILISYKVLTALYLNRQWGGTGLSRETLSGFWGHRLSQVFPRLLKSRLIRFEHSQSRREKTTLNYLGENKLLERFPLLTFIPRTLGTEFHGQKTPSSVSFREGSPWYPFNLTLVIFNIPESQRASRDRLRYQLKTLGFGSLSRSVYLSPHLSVKETRLAVSDLWPVSGGQLSEVPDASVPTLRYGMPTEASGIGIPTPSGRRDRSQRSLVVLSLPLESFKEVGEVERFWDLKKINDFYERALASFEVFKDSSKFLNYFITGLFLDPLLPAPIQPKNALINKCLDIAKEILS